MGFTRFLLPHVAAASMRGTSPLVLHPPEFSPPVQPSACHHASVPPRRHRLHSSARPRGFPPHEHPLCACTVAGAHPPETLLGFPSWNPHPSSPRGPTPPEGCHPWLRAHPRLRPESRRGVSDPPPSSRPATRPGLPEACNGMHLRWCLSAGPRACVRDGGGEWTNATAGRPTLFQRAVGTGCLPRGAKALRTDP